MDWRDLLTRLFGADHDITADGHFLHGTARFHGAPISVVGTVDHAPIGAALALQQAAAILGVMVQSPGRPILLLIDTQGQQLRRRDELLGINRAMAHLGCCVDAARRSGHSVIGLIYAQALSGGFITTGLAADACYALPDAEIRVMRIPAMARVTKLPEALLTALAQSNPVFSPGVQNYVAMGAVRSLWPADDLPAALRQALTDAGGDGGTDDAGGTAAAEGGAAAVTAVTAAAGATATATATASASAGTAAGADTHADTRAADGLSRGGRLHAAVVTRQVLDAP